jgi:2-oxoisovalerate dehydrogenase E1 component
MIAMAARPSDPALLHYRSGGFYLARAQQVAGSTAIRDVLQGLMGLADEPIAGGRHKVFGHPDLAVIPQTSTIASHLPRAVGLAIALHRADRLGVDCEWPSDAVVVCSFGDASANHSTAAGAINTAVASAFRGLPVPILLVCEDNGFGISVPTPAGWIEAAYGSRPGLSYVSADGSDPANAWPAIADAVDRVRDRRRPVFLHLRPYASEATQAAMPRSAIENRGRLRPDYARDPLLATCVLPPRDGCRRAEILACYDDIRGEIDREVTEVVNDRRLGSAAEVMAPIAPRNPGRVAGTVRTLTMRPEAIAGPPPRKRTLAESINATLDEPAHRRSPSDRFSARTLVSRAGSTASPRAWLVSMAPLGSSTRCSTSRRFLVLDWALVSPG